MTINFKNACKQTIKFNELVREVKRDMYLYNVPYDDNYRILVDDITSYGVCKYIDKDIIINKKLVLFGNEQDIKNTICHELIHSAPQCRYEGHRGFWKTCANVMNNHGYDIKARCHYELNVDYTTIYKYVVKCANCGMIQGFNRKRDVIKNPYNYRCGICNQSKIIVIKGGE